MKKHIHASDLAELVRSAESSQRARTHLNTHDSTDADVQRLFIATMPSTYIRPHRHSEAHKRDAPIGSTPLEGSNSSKD